MNNKPREVAIAILHRDGKFLLQLRDNIPSIVYPGCWALFGGHLELGETPEDALNRELMEEIGYIPPTSVKFGCYWELQIIRHVYHALLTVDVNQLALNEGWDLGLLTSEEIGRGSSYSVKAGQERPLGRPHQQILLNFIDSRFPKVKPL
ncbi:MAG: NUDIX hydrolase [Chamaesiphon sp.]